MSQKVSNVYYDAVTVIDANVAQSVTSALFNHRIIFIYDPINSSSAQQICQSLIYLSNKSSEPIYLNICSPGGSVYDAFSIVNTMMTIRAPVRTTVVGLAASAAALIFVCGQKGHRIMLPESILMFHQVLSCNPNYQSYPDLQISFEQTKYLNDKIMSIIADCIDMNIEECRQKMNRDWFVSANEAIEYKMADKIVPKYNHETAII